MRRREVFDVVADNHVAAVYRKVGDGSEFMDELRDLQTRKKKE